MLRNADPPPSYYEPPEEENPTRCPICGEETDTFIRSKHDGVILGCPECIEDVDAWDWRTEHE